MVQRCPVVIAPDVGAPPQGIAEAVVAVGLMTTATTARAESHQVCLDFELGPQLFDASPRQPSGDTCPMFSMSACDPGDENLVAWETCVLGQCVPTTSELGEDYGRWEGARPFTAMRWLFRVKDVSSEEEEVIWGWDPLDDNGCTGMFEVGASTTDVTLEWMRWTVSPTGHAILGYECELDDDGGMPQGADGACGELATTDVTLEVGESSSTCGGGTESVDHCTLHTLGGLDLDPIDYNLWSATFADSRINFFEPTQVYLLQELDNSNNTGTKTGPWLGRHHSIRFKHNLWHSKRVPAHEYGHLAFFNIPNHQGSHPTVYFPPPGDIDYGGDSHTLGSAEWQAAAAVEGFGNIAALATWNDLTEDDTVFHVSLVQDGLGAEGVDELTPHPIAMPPWDSPETGDGEANEYNWGSAVRQLLRAPSPTATLEQVAGMLPAVHESAWHPSGEDNLFRDAFIAAMNTYFDGSLEAKWSNLADEFNLYAEVP